MERYTELVKMEERIAALQRYVKDKKYANIEDACDILKIEKHKEK